MVSLSTLALSMLLNGMLAVSCVATAPAAVALGTLEPFATHVDFVNHLNVLLKVFCQA